ncbi:MAG: hypothetical protein OXE99_10050 [Cellvibrionales bacterium]|nr:hypothetical protein [Cellvibrionales bacterium]
MNTNFSKKDQEKLVSDITKQVTAEAMNVIRPLLEKVAESMKALEAERQQLTSTQDPVAENQRCLQELQMAAQNRLNSLEHRVNASLSAKQHRLLNRSTGRLQMTPTQNPQG